MGYSYVVGVALVLLVCLYAFGSHRKPKGPFPPGPPTIPILGNLHQIPLSKSYITFAEWARTYTPDGLLGLRLGPYERVLVLNKWQHARDLLDLRGSVYSDRPRSLAADIVTPGDIHPAFMPYSAHWRKSRRIITEFLKDSEVEKLLPVQEAESSQMIYDLLTDTAEERRYHGHVMRFFGGVVLATVFGQRQKTYGPESFVRRFFAVQDEWAGFLDPGALPPYNIFPLLKYVPDSFTPWRGWRERGESLRTRQRALYRELFETAAIKVAAGRSQDCFVARMLQDPKIRSGEFDQLQLDYIAGFLLEGGSDTSALAFLTFVLAMATHPDILAQVQQEVDAVFGATTMPHKVEEGRLPFLRACILETLRWRPGFALAVPHATLQDDVLPQGYVIPKGTTVLLNTWAVQHDPDEFLDPDVFDPSRYLANPYGTKKGGSETGDTPQGDTSRRQTYAFGAGRRVCAGQRMAENTLMLTTSKLAWAFDIIPGGELDTNARTGFKDAILTGPQEFSVEFVLRDDGRKQVIVDEFAKADAFLSRYE
ncbi:cytochrome P450 [Thozetella sp. PMI_491]|nr:cytochrome P450 [Thozetella sp. PMI_491]